MSMLGPPEFRVRTAFVAVAGALVLLLTAASPASAGTAQVGADGSTVEYTAPGGEVNTVTITLTGNTIIVAVDLLVGDVGDDTLRGGSGTGYEPDRVLATILFTDIVESTRRAAELGDAAWRLNGTTRWCARRSRRSTGAS